jgi:UDP-N-acetylglucosamine transferase subunit ALG13
MTPSASPPSNTSRSDEGGGPFARRALFAISSLGLGHATRSLVLIRAYLADGYEVTVVCTGNALAFLRLELGRSAQVEFFDMPDYPPLERGRGWRLYWYLVLDLLRTWRLIRSEHQALERIAAGFDFIFSDGRYGFYSRWTPSFMLSHQVAFIPPKGLREASWLTEHVNVSALRKFDCLFIPDYPGPSANLAGHLAHSPNLHRCEHRYVGILSSYRRLPLEQDIDYLFVISGYLLEHKDRFIRSLLEQARDLPGHKVFVLGAAGTDAEDYGEYRNDDLEIFPVASGAARQELFSRARCVISRAGYTTIMDLVEHDKHAVLIPTPNQTEQEYLGQYLDGQGYFVARDQRGDLDIVAALHECERRRPFAPPWRTEDSLRRVREGIEPMLHRHFFSIIVPAHNEERELPETLGSLLAQSYPADRFEIIVVENGSTDATFERARDIAGQPSAAGRLRLLQSPRGVSRAKNVGLAAAADESDWVVLCDADTRLGTAFLHHLNTWLLRHGHSGSVGTTAVAPHHDVSLYARLWFAFYDVIHRVTKTSYAIQIARTSVARGVGFDEQLHLSEDLRFIRECCRYGRFLFVPTDQVMTSTRRFEACGYLRQSLRWLVQALLPARFKRHRPYHVVR